MALVALVLASSMFGDGATTRGKRKRAVEQDARERIDRKNLNAAILNYEYEPFSKPLRDMKDDELREALKKFGKIEVSPPLVLFRGGPPETNRFLLKSCCFFGSWVHRKAMYYLNTKGGVLAWYMLKEPLTLYRWLYTDKVRAWVGEEKNAEYAKGTDNFNFAEHEFHMAMTKLGLDGSCSADSNEIMLTPAAYKKLEPVDPRVNNFYNELLNEFETRNPVASPKLRKAYADLSPEEQRVIRVALRQLREEISEEGNEIDYLFGTGLYQPDATEEIFSKPAGRDDDDKEVLRRIETWDHFVRSLASPLSLDDFLVAVRQNGLVLQHVNANEQTAEICLAAVQQNGLALQFVEKQTPNICLAAVQQNGAALKHVKDQTHEICLAAVQQNGKALKHVKDQTHEICLAAVQQNGAALKHVKVREHTPEICLAAVQQDGLALQFVRVQTENICLAAVRQDGLALQFVRVQTPEICLAAVRQDGLALQFVRVQTPEICLAAVRQNGEALQWVREPTPEIRQVAVMQMQM